MNNKVIAIMNEKGGAYKQQQQQQCHTYYEKKKVLLIDFDGQANYIIQNIVSKAYEDFLNEVLKIE